MAYPRGFIIGPEKALRNKLWLCRSKYALHLLSFIGFKTPLSIEFISMQARGRLISGGGGGGGIIIGCTANKSYMKGIIEKLNPVKTVGCDFISQRLLRLSAPVITQPLTKLINHFLTNRLWPTVWKSSNITSVFKKASETNKTCYRPVSILPALRFKRR